MQVLPKWECLSFKVVGVMDGSEGRGAGVDRGQGDRGPCRTFRGTRMK